MGLFEAIRRANCSAWQEAIRWLIINFFVVFIPIGSTYLFTYNNTGKIIFIEPISHGELSLVSISFLGAGIYIISKGLKITGLPQIKRDKKLRNLDKIFEVLANISFPGSTIFIPTIFIEVIFAVILFMISFSQNTGLANYQEIQYNRIRITLIIMVICFLTTFLITLVESSITNSSLDAQDMFRKSTENWQEKMKNEQWRS
jgi:hypothetical protein